MALKKLPGGVVVETTDGARLNEDAGINLEAIHRQIIAGAPTTEAARAEADRAEAAARDAETARDASTAAVQAVPLGGSGDLNTLTTSQTRSLTLSAEVNALNSPSPGTRLIVTTRANTTGSGIVQEARALQSNRAWSRSYYAGSWTAWTQHDLKALPDSDADVLTSSSDLGALTTGRYAVASTGVATALALPAASIGVLEVIPLVTGRFQVFRTEGSLYQRYRSAATGATWSPWRRLDGDTGGQVAKAGPGLKVVPVPLSVGGGSANSLVTGSVRFPVHLNAPVHRFRLHVDNMNPRYGSPRRDAVALGAVYVGADAGGGTMSAPRLLTTLPDIPAGQSSAVSPWVHAPEIGYGQKSILSFGIAAAAAVAGLVGGCWTSPLPADAGVAAPSGLTRSTTAPMQVWLEVETAATTPVVAGVGSSSTCGVGATLPVHGSALSILCRRLGALPVHYGAAGDTMANWATYPEHAKWTQWSHLDRADAVLQGLGSNDVFGSGATLAQMQGWHSTIMGLARRHIAPVVYETTMPPRTSSTGAAEDVRRAYNAWLATQPDGARDLFDYAAAVSADDETIRPEMDADGIHVNDAGHAATAAAVTRPVAPTSPWLIEQRLNAIQGAA